MPRRTAFASAQTVRVSGFCLREFLPQGPFRHGKCGSEAVADEQEQLVNFVLVVDVRRGIALFQHDKPYGRIIQEPGPVPIFLEEPKKKAFVRRFDKFFNCGIL